MRHLVLALIPLSLIVGAATAVAQGIGHGRIGFGDRSQASGSARP